MFRKLLTILLFALIPMIGYAVASPIFDTASTNSGTATLFVQSHTSSGLNRFMIIEVGYDPSTSDPVTLVTYNGNTATELFNLESAEHGLYVYYVMNPNTGANPVSIFLSASVKCAIGVRTYTGVCMSSPIGDNAGVTVNANSGAVTVTTTVDNAMVLGCASWEGTNTLTVDGSQTERYVVTALGGSPSTRTTMKGDEEEKVTAGDVEMSYSYSVVSPGVIHAVEIHPPQPADTPTPTPTITNTPEITLTPVFQDFKRLYWLGHPETFAEGTASLLRFENNVEDATGLEDNWINNGPTPFNGTTFQQGAYSIGVFSTGDCVTNTVTAAIKTVEMYFNHADPTNHTDDRLWSANDGTHLVLRTDNDSGQFKIRYLLSGWSATYNLSSQTWYHAGFITDDGSGDSFLYIDDVERLTQAASHTIASGTLHYVGCGLNGANVSAFSLIDEFRISIDSKTSFPTTD